MPDFGRGGGRKLPLGRGLPWLDTVTECQGLNALPGARRGWICPFVCRCGLCRRSGCGEIRKHLDAELREAEIKSQVERLEHDLQIARSVQQSLLPKSRPQIAGFQVAGWNRPADDTGGDFYDWKQLADGRWVMVLADVTGHGIGPAILASVCRAYSRASFNARDNLETSLKNINHSFAKDLTPERFATFVAAVCQQQKDQLELLSAGHGPLLIYRASDQSFQFLEAQTLPLGILPEIDGASPVKIDMKPSDIVLLVTDGFFEWENPTQEQFGTKRLAEVIQRCSDSDPETIIAELYDSVRTFSQGAPQKDDLTAILIKRTGNDSPETDHRSGKRDEPMTKNSREYGSHGDHP